MTKEILAKIDNEQIMTLRTNKKAYKVPVMVMVELINDTVNKFGPIKEESIITFNMPDNAYNHIINLIEEYEKQQIYSKVRQQIYSKSLPDDNKNKNAAR